MPELPDRINGEIIEASHMNDAQDRTVQRYTSAANRDTLNPLPVEGQMAWLSDVNQLTTYDGSKWIEYSQPGAIESNFTNPVDAGITAAQDTYQAVASFAITSTGTWTIWADGWIQASLGVDRPTWTIAITVSGVERETTVMSAVDAEMQSPWAFHSTSVFNDGNTVVLSVKRNNIVGTQLAHRFKLSGIRLS